MNIKKKIAHLKTKYKTNNPFELADLLGILILYEELGSINGYYNKQLRLKQIHINCNLNRHEMHFTCAHELGHAVLHPSENTQFLRNNTLLSVDKLEIEANKFAMELLLSDEMLNEYKEYSIEQIARILGYNEKLIELRIK